MINDLSSIKPYIHKSFFEIIENKTGETRIKILDELLKFFEKNQKLVIKNNLKLYSENYSKNFWENIIDRDKLGKASVILRGRNLTIDESIDKLSKILKTNNQFTYFNLNSKSAFFILDLMKYLIFKKPSKNGMKYISFNKIYSIKHLIVDEDDIQFSPIKPPNDGEKLLIEKMKCINNYLENGKKDNRKIGFILKSKNINDIHKYLEDKNIENYPDIKVNYNKIGNGFRSSKKLSFSESFLEDDEEEEEKENDYLLVDFANEYIGGGVLDDGALQEEILFLKHPEAILSMLFFDKMKDNEAILIKNVLDCSVIDGYGRYDPQISNPIKYIGNLIEEKIRFNDIIAIDAYKYDINKLDKNIEINLINRDLIKVLVGFSKTDVTDIKPISSGLWGCGNFNGDYYIKSILQIISTIHNERDLYFYIPNDKGNFLAEFEDFADFCKIVKIKPHELYTHLINIVNQLKSHNGYLHNQTNFFELIINDVKKNLK